MGLSAIKAQARLGIHARMAEPCTYSDGVEPTVPTVEQQAAGLTLTARFHTKLRTNLANVSDGLTVMEPIEKVVFNATELAALGLTLEQGSVVTFPAYDLSVTLDQEMDGDGPENVYWTVTRA